MTTTRLCLDSEQVGAKPKNPRRVQIMKDMTNGSGSIAHPLPGNNAVSARALALARNWPPGQRDKLAASIIADGKPVKASKQLVALLCATTIPRIDIALNGSRPRRPKPSRKTLAELDTLFKVVRNAAGAMRWRGEDYQRDELLLIDRQISKFLVAHPDVQDWRSLGGSAAQLEHAVDALAFLVETIVVNDLRGYE
jgi:hypothetical protein